MNVRLGSLPASFAFCKTHWCCAVNMRCGMKTCRGSEDTNPVLLEDCMGWKKLKFTYCHSFCVLNPALTSVLRFRTELESKLLIKEQAVSGPVLGLILWTTCVLKYRCVQSNLWTDFLYLVHLWSLLWIRFHIVLHILFHSSAQPFQFLKLKVCFSNSFSLEKVKGWSLAP